MKQKITLLVLLALSVVCTGFVSASVVTDDDETTNLILFKESSRAKCLDGSPAGFYYFPGSGSDTDKFLIFLQGGGGCASTDVNSTISECAKRSLTDLGSSKNWPQSYKTTGIFSTIQKNNPLFANWHKVYVHYCDGVFFQGSSSPITYAPGKSIVFRGYDIMTELIATLQDSYALNSKSNVVLAGASAGAIGSMSWSQYLRNALPQSVRVVNMPDSGYFPYIEPENPSTSQYLNLIDLITDNNRGIYQPQGCKYLENPATANKCMSTAYMYEYIPVPVLFINSLYDEYTLRYILNVECVSTHHSFFDCSDEDFAKILWLHDRTKSDFKAIQAARPHWGAWTISCILHVFSLNPSYYSSGGYSVPRNSKYTVAKAMQDFILGVNNDTLQNGQFTQDPMPYPDNYPCNGIIVE